MLLTGKCYSGVEKRSSEGWALAMATKQAQSAQRRTWNGAIPNRAERHGRKRRAVLSMAARMFAEEGYHETSLASIAKRLNVTKPTLYYYIDNKQEIRSACIDEGLQVSLEMLAEAQEGVADSLGKLRRYCRLHIEFVLGDFGALLVVTGRRELSAAQRRKMHKIDDAITQLIEGCVAEGALKPCDAKMACYALIGALNAVPLWFRETGGKSSKEVVEAYLDVFLGGLVRD